MNEDKTVVRLKTEVYTSGNRLVIKRTLSNLKRKSTGFNLLEDEISQAGAEDVYHSIVNLNESEDGIYELVMCNLTTDWETGHVDGWKLKLIPFKECST